MLQQMCSKCVCSTFEFWVTLCFYVWRTIDAHDILHVHLSDEYYEGQAVDEPGEMFLFEEGSVVDLMYSETNQKYVPIVLYCFKMLAKFNIVFDVWFDV